MPCPERGWDPDEPVRVCKTCYDRKSTANQVKLSAQSPRREPQEAVQARRYVIFSFGGQTQKTNYDAMFAVLSSILCIIFRYGEKVVGTLNSLASAMLEYPINAIKETARPSYWVPDDEITSCFVCDTLFENATNPTPSPSLTTSLRGEEGGRSATSPINHTTTQNSATNSSVQLAKLHHCRKCGQGVCDDCSRTKKPVPDRGWDQPVRVCDKCCADDLRTS